MADYCVGKRKPSKSDVMKPADQIMRIRSMPAGCLTALVLLCFINTHNTYKKIITAD